MAGMRDLMSGYADSASDTLGRWANGLRSAATGEAPAGAFSTPGMSATERPFTAADSAAFPQQSGGAFSTPGMTATERPFTAADDAAFSQARPGGSSFSTQGMSATERPWTAADNASFPNSPQAAAEAAHGARVNPGPASSNFTSSGYQDHFGPQAAANEGAAAGEAGAANASKFAGARGFFTGGSPGVGSAIKSVGAGVAKAAAPLIRGNVVLGGALGTLQGANTDTSDYERRFGLAPNTSSGVTGFARDAGVRALGVASDIGNSIALGLPKQFLYRDGPNGDAPSAPAAPPTSLANGPAARTDVQSGGAAAPAVQGTPVANADGVRRLSPNSFTNVPGDNTGQTGYGVSSLGGGPETLGREQRAADIYKQMAAIQDGADAQPGVLSAGGGMRVVGTSNGLFRKTDPVGSGASLSDLTRSGISPRTAATFINAQRANEIALRGQDISRLNSQDSNATSLRRTGMENETSRANNLGTTGAAIYGHELSRAGTRAQLEYERFKGDRQYGLDKAKFGEEQAQHNFTQREQAVKDAHTEIGNMLAPVDDGTGKKVPDTATAARYAQGLITLVGERQAQLAQRAQAGDKTAAGQLEQLSTKQLGALSPEDKQRFVAGMKATDLANQYHSGAFNPIGGTGMATTAPVKSMKRVSSLTGDYYQTDTGAKIPARAVEKENADFFGGKHRVDLNVLTH